MVASKEFHHLSNVLNDLKKNTINADNFLLTRIDKIDNDLKKIQENITALQKTQPFSQKHNNNFIIIAISIIYTLTIIILSKIL